MKKSFFSFLLLFSAISINSFGQWSLQYYVDDFGDKTNESYISYTDYNGVFSNSATSGSKLITKLLVGYSIGDTIPTFRFDLGEYDRGPFVGKIVEGSYTLKIKLSNSTTQSYDLYECENSLYIRSENKDSESFFQYLKTESSDIKCYLKIDNLYLSQSYLFKINPIGFSNAHSKLSVPKFRDGKLIDNTNSKLSLLKCSEESLMKDNSIVDFASVEVMPEFPGGREAWEKYLQKNMNYPPNARENNITGRVIVSFVVEKNGDLTDIKVLRGIGGGCDEEAIRLLKTAPAWKPGLQNGRSVRVAYTMPIFFQ